MKRFISCVLTMFIVSASSVSAKKHEPRPLCLVQPSSPLGLVKCLTDYDTDLLVSAKVKNVSQSAITSYRIGWMTFHRFVETKVTLGGMVQGGSAITPGQTVKVPPQSISPKVGQDASAIAFFVAEIHFADGKVWNAEMKEVKREAKALKSKPPIFSDAPW